MPTLRGNFRVALFGLTLIAPLAWAQQQSEDQSTGNPAPPIQAVRVPLSSAAGDGTDQNTSETLDPDTRPPTGAQDLSLGTPSTIHSYWQPYFGLNSTFNSNPLATNNAPGWANWTAFNGGVNLQRVSENNQLGLYCLAGGSVTNNNSAGNVTYQTASLAEQIGWGRSTIAFFDSLSYLPQAAFGFAGATGVPLPTGGAIGLQPGFVPNDAVLTQQTQRITNSFVTQVNTQLTRRSSLTFTGGFNTLHYFGTALLNSDGFNFQAGYNYRLTREDTISMFYSFSGFRYSNYSQSINNHSFGVSYSRRLTGRLALRVGAGPSFSSFQTPFTGIPASGSPGTGPGTQVYFSVNSGLSYERWRTNLSVNYRHGISGGSGVLAGAISDNVFGSASRQLTRAITGGLSFGYARNSGRSIATPTSSTYGSSFADVNLSRRLGPSTNISVSYQFQYQTTSQPPCVGQTCGTSCVSGLVCASSFTRHGVWLTLNWQKQPIVF